jgi:predicted nucleotidyltransferase
MPAAPTLAAGRDSCIIRSTDRVDGCAEMSSGKLRDAMITEHERNVIRRYAEKYHVGLVLLFGSSLEPGAIAQDVDLGVKGIDLRLFFKFYGELVKHLSKPVDLVDLSHKSLFNDVVEETGLRIYEGSGQENRGGEALQGQKLKPV